MLELQPVRVRVKLPALEPRQATARWVARLACRKLGPIHSTDRVSVHHGHATPTRVCGFHASTITDWGKVRTAQ